MYSQKPWLFAGTVANKRETSGAFRVEEESNEVGPPEMTGMAGYAATCGVDQVS